MWPQRKPLRWLHALALLILLGGLLGPTLLDPPPAEAAFGNRRYTVPANGTLEVIIRGFCLDKPRHFPGAFLEPSDHQVQDDVLKTFAFSVAKGYARKQIYQTQLALWYLRDHQWFNETANPPRPRDIAQEIVRQGLTSPLREKPTDAPTLIEAVQSGAIKAEVNDFHATTENYEGEGTLVLTNLTDQPVTLYITVGTVFKAATEGEQRMITWARGGLSGYTRAESQSGFTVNVRNVESRGFPRVNTIVSVLDSRQMAVRDLDAARFEVLEDGNPSGEVSIRSVADSVAEEPLSLVVLLDGNEQALRSGQPDGAAGLAADFIAGLKDKDSVRVIATGDRVTTVQDATQDKNAAASKVRSMAGSWNSHFFDGVVASLESVGKMPKGRPAIVIFGSARDWDSDPEGADVLDWAAEQGTPIFTMATPNAERNMLDPFASATGGLAFAPSPAELPAAAEAIESYLREHYRLDFVSNLKADGRPHKLEVRIKGDEAQRPGRESFLAYPNKAQVEMLTPAENGQLQPHQRVEFTVNSAAPITEIELIADGKPLTTLKSEPWVYDWNTDGLSNGQHSLNIIVHDRAGNRTVKSVPLVVGSGARVREQASSQPQVSQRSANTMLGVLPIVGGLIGVVALAAGAFFGVKVGLPKLRARRGNRCPIHGVRYPRDGACPVCVLNASSQVRDRLAQFSRPTTSPPGD